MRKYILKILGQLFLNNVVDLVGGIKNACFPYITVSHLFTLRHPGLQLEPYPFLSH
jgi:hypothetical protein